MGKDWRSRAKKISTETPSSDWRSRATKVDNLSKVVPTIQEQHPEISWDERAIAKNFAQDQTKQIEYLKKENPGLEFDLSSTGQIRVRKPNADKWNVVDPDTGVFSSDILSDIGDIGYDLYAAGSEGLATTLAALSGGAATGGLGAIPAGMAAGGATTAANEAMRQKLGQYMGIPQEVNWDDVKVSGTVGTFAPALFGAGKATGLIQKGAGAAGKTMSKYNPLPWLGEKVSGVPREVLRNYSDDGIRETVKRLEKEGISEYTGKVFDRLKNYVETRKEKAGEALIDSIDETGSYVDMAPAKETFEGSIDDLANREARTIADEKKIEQLKRIRNENMGQRVERVDEILDEETGEIIENIVESVEPIPDELSARRAWDIQKDLKQAAKFEQGMSPADVHAKGTARDAYFRVNEALDEASEGLTSDAKAQYKAALQEEAELLPKFTGKTRADSIQKTYNEMSRMSRDSRKALSEKLSKLSDEEILNLTDEAKVLSTYRWLGKPNISPISSGGTTSTSRTIPLAIAGGSLGSLAGYNSGGGYAGATVGGAGGAMLGTLLGSPAAMKAYIRAMRKAGRSRELYTPKADNNLWRAARMGTLIEASRNQVKED